MMFYVLDVFTKVANCIKAATWGIVFVLFVLLVFDPWDSSSRAFVVLSSCGFSLKLCPIFACFVVGCLHPQYAVRVFLV